MLFRLLVLFVVTPFVELTILLWLADVTDWTYTLALIVVTGIVGTMLVRWQGLRAYTRIQQEMAAGRLPGEALADGLMILLAGAFLLTPGVLTDLFGFSLLLPICRGFYRRLLMRWFQVRTFPGDTFSGGPFAGGGPFPNGPSADEPRPGGFDAGPFDRPPGDRIIDVDVIENSDRNESE